MHKRNTRYPILDTDHVYAVILVGGKGKRLRPLSTHKRPKPFLSVTSDRKTMFRKAFERACKIVPRDRVIVVANRAHARLVAADAPEIDTRNILAEPVSRNTANAIALAAIDIEIRDPSAIMVVIPADHYIDAQEKFVETIRRAIALAVRQKNALVTIGIRPTFPSTEYGYIQVTRSPGHQVTSKGCRVKKFVEKPDAATARRYVKEERYLWNSGTFVFSARAIIDALKRFEPSICKILHNDAISLSRRYRRLPDISIDYAVMERATNIFCVGASYRWYDVGSFERLKEVLKKESRSFIERNGKVTKII